MPFIQSTLLPRPSRKAPVAYPALVDPALAGFVGWVTKALRSRLSFPRPPWRGFIAGIWKLFLFTQSHFDAAARCAPANGNPGFPAGSFERLHATRQLFCRERLGPVTSAWRKHYHLCKQVILVYLPVLCVGNASPTWRQLLLLWL